MKRTLLALGLAGALALPAGAAIAQSGSAGVANDDPAMAAVQVREQARDQARLQDPATCDGDCDGAGVAGVVPAKGQATNLVAPAGEAEPTGY